MIPTASPLLNTFLLGSNVKSIGIPVATQGLTAASYVIQTIIATKVYMINKPPTKRILNWKMKSAMPNKLSKYRTKVNMSMDT